MFCSEVELGKFLGSIDTIPDAYTAITETSSTYQLHKRPSGIQVLAFSCSPDYTTRFLKGDFDLVSSQNHKVDFISTKVNPKFLINKTSVELFEHLLPLLPEIQNQLVDSSPLVVTGQGLGGYLAILFTLWRQDSLDEKESRGAKNIKRPICITFGSPLLGDKDLQKAISERPQWKSCFLNVVAKSDLVASFISSKSKYKPFGTFLFCEEESGGHTAFEDQEVVLAVLDAMASSHAGNLEMYNYRNVLRLIRKKVLYRGVSESGKFDLNPLMSGIRLQFKEVGVLNDISNDVIGKVEKNKARVIRSKKNVYEPTKKLNEMKISLTYMEWYMKTRVSKGGYYDCYRDNNRSKEENESYLVIVKHIGWLKQYWKKTVEEKAQNPQKEGSKLRKRWLFGGTNYRRIIEPLDIAEYYRNGKTDYMAYRPEHYKLLEKWANEENDMNPSNKGKNKAASLTEDSCFWARVEEALISVRALNGGLKGNAASIEHGKLNEFESYLMDAINGFSLSPDVFVEGSSLMKWWVLNKACKERSHASEFAHYMNNETYRSYK